MASPTEFSDGRKSPRNIRKVPHSLTTSFFSKPRKGGDARSPTLHSPIITMTGPGRPTVDVSVVRATTASNETASNPRTEPIAIPDAAQLSSQKHKKLAPSTTFNTHYRSISRSMNDLGNIFSRGRSPPNQDVSPRRPAGPAVAQDTRRKGTPESPHARSFESGSVPSISVMQHGDQLNRGHIIREGWLNVIDSGVKKGTMRESFKLHYAMISDGQMMFYKPPSSFQIRAFELGARLPSPQRPQSAPASASPTFNVSSLQHRSLARHPELVLGNHGTVTGGTVEALCHELMFTKDGKFVEWAARSLSGWTGPETALSVLLELSALKDSSARISSILNIVADATPGLLLGFDCYNCARLLVEKGINPHSPELAKSARITIERTRSSLLKVLNISGTRDEPRTPLTDNFSGSLTLTADEFLRIDPTVLADQVHLYHLKYYRAWSPADDISLLLVSPHLPPPNYRNPLVFGSSNFHFLGERVLNHVLCGDATRSVNQRVALLSRWIRIAELLKQQGDVVGYVAIIMAILSPPILRLRETWSAMCPNLLAELRDSGAKVMLLLERRRFSVQPDISDGRVLVPMELGVEMTYSQEIPFFGDLCHCMDEAYASRTRNIDYQKLDHGLKVITASLNRWETEWVGRVSGKGPERDTKEEEGIQNCLHYLNLNLQNPPSVNSTLFFEKSLACEPSPSGMYLQSHYHQKLPLSTGANIPLIFTDIRASFSLFDRSDTLAISGNLHKKTPSSGLASPANAMGSYPIGMQPNHNLRPPVYQGQQTLRRTRSFPPSMPSGQTTGYDDLDFTTRERTAVLQGGDNAMLRAIRDVAGVGQRLFHSKDGELVLKSITDDSQSRPSSVIERTSKRQSVVSRRYSQIHSTGASPRASVYGDVSLPTTPTREGFNLDPTPSLLVVPKGGTLERLVDILVLGVEDFSRRMTGPAKGGSARPPLLRMDMNVFTITFFATFRSYCSPIVLIDYLKKRLLGSKSAASFSNDESDDVVFPDWTGVDHVKDDAVDWSLVAKIHLGILDAIHIWITEFHMDFHCDQYLTESFISFLDIASKELHIWRLLSPDKVRLRTQADEINALWLTIKEKFANLTFAPSLYEPPNSGTMNINLSIPESINVGAISEFVEVLDLRIAELFRAVKLVDWMFAFELLETQSAEPMGFFVPKVAVLSHEEEDAIQDIFFLLGHLRRGNSHTTVLQALPKSLRDLCTLHTELTHWILSQLVEPRISVERRSQRIATLLKALTICRKRMSGMDLYDNTDSRVCRHVPSFSGSAIAAALVRSESRMFSYAWHSGVRLACGTVSSIETLEQVIPDTIDGVVPARPLTPSVGWMFERLLEIICHVPNMVVENNRLINFDKRRYVYNFINNFTNGTGAHVAGERRNIFSLKTAETPDVRSLREIAYRENQLLRHSRVKVFWKLMHQEQEKIRRDTKQREAMDRQHKHQLRAEHRRQPTAIRVETAEKKGGKRLGVNSIFKAVRPISMAFTSGWAPPQNIPKIVPPSELPLFKGIEQGRKPVATIDLKQVSSISCPRGIRDQGLWRITSAAGPSYLLQATSEKELDEWLKAITAIRGVSASDGSESIDLLAGMSQNRIPQPVFGVPLEELCKRDSVKVPVVVETLLSEIELRGLSEVGIYRVPGSLASVNALKNALDSGEDVKMDDDRWYDINVIAGAFKSFMRELPANALGSETLNELRDLTAEIPEEKDRILRYRDVMLRQPPHNYYFLRRLYIHFFKIAGNAAVNKMHAVNLAIVFGMGLSPGSSHPFGISPDLGLYQTMVKTWITYAEQIFPDVEFDDNGSGSGSVVPTESGVPSEPASPSSLVLPPLNFGSGTSPRMSLDELRPMVGEGGHDIRL